MRAREVVAGIGTHPAVHATAAGLYAWAITVLPVAWSQGATQASKAAAMVAIVALGGGWLGGRLADHARTWALWSFVLACAFAWSAAPNALAPLHVDVYRGVAGTLAWAVFAFAWAAPAFAPRAQGGEEDGRALEHSPLAPRQRLLGRDGYVLSGAGLLVAGIAAIGWEVPSLERSLLVRLVCLAGSLAVLDVTVAVLLAHYPKRARPSTGGRLKAARPWLVGLGLLALLGAFAAVKG